MTIGSLFDGSGGFPLAAVINGVQPLWASEIEPYPIRVSKKRFPKMKHLGSVTEINGATVEPVDIITFGSPCQDLSVAGKQAGLQDGTRSNLFFEAIRIIKEMRHATNNLSPRVAVWENVPGAFSSNKGEDFRAVLQAFAQVCDPTADVPKPPKNKWGGQEPSWETDGAWLGELSTRNFGESPSVVVESTLSQILEVNAPEKYYLSKKACEGILRRAEARGKELPQMLKEALEEVLTL